MTVTQERLDDRGTDASVPRQGSLLASARSGDAAAITTMFRQFVPADEQVVAAEYLGTQGLWGIGIRSFACVTDRRVAALRVKIFGGIEYQDASLEEVNSGVIHQPSRLGLYVFTLVASLLTLGLALILLPFTVRIYYGFKKSGFVFQLPALAFVRTPLASRFGMSVYVYSDRKLMPRAAAVYRSALAMRERRVGGPTHAVGMDTTPLATPAQPPARSNEGPLGAASPTRVGVGRGSRLAVGVSVVVGAILLGLAAFLPYVNADGVGTSLADNGVWFVLQPLGVAVAAGLIALGAFAMSDRTTFVGPALFAFGAQLALLFFGLLGWTLVEDALDPGIAAPLGLLAAGLLVASGAVVLGAQQPEER